MTSLPLLLLLLVAVSAGEVRRFHHALQNSKRGLCDQLAPCPCDVAHHNSRICIDFAEYMDGSQDKKIYYSGHYTPNCLYYSLTCNIIHPDHGNQTLTDVYDFTNTCGQEFTYQYEYDTQVNGIKVSNKRSTTCVHGRPCEVMTVNRTQLAQGHEEKKEYREYLTVVFADRRTRETLEKMYFARFDTKIVTTDGTAYLDPIWRRISNKEELALCDNLHKESICDKRGIGCLGSSLSGVMMLCLIVVCVALTIGVGIFQRRKRLLAEYQAAATGPPGRVNSSVA